MKKHPGNHPPQHHVITIYRVLLPHHVTIFLYISFVSSPLLDFLPHVTNEGREGIRFSQVLRCFVFFCRGGGWSEGQKCTGNINSSRRFRPLTPNHTSCNSKLQGNLHSGTSYKRMFYIERNKTYGGGKEYTSSVAYTCIVQLLQRLTAFKLIALSLQSSSGLLHSVKYNDTKPKPPGSAVHGWRKTASAR